MDSTLDRGVSLKVNRLLGLADVNTVVDELVAMLKTNSPSLDSVAVIADSGTGRLRFDSLRASSPVGEALGMWMAAHFEKHPALNQKLQRSELVALRSADAGINSQSAEGIRANVVLVPVVSNGKLIAALGLLSRGDESDTLLPDASGLEYLRCCALEAAAPLACMQELESLRKENGSLKGIAHSLSTAEAELTDLRTRVSQLEGVGAMSTHLQSNVAHEMRTPLAAVRGYSRMVLEGDAGDLIPTQREYLEIAIDNTNKLIHLVNWMTRVTEGSEKLTLTSVDLRELWRDCSSSHSKELANAGVRIEEAPIPAGSYSFLADKAKMQRVFQQMLRAAAQFAERGTTLKLEFSRPRRGGLALKLSGMTIGAAAEALEFPFNGPAQDILSDVHDIISMHGGRFFVRRTPEEGWVFLFTLPAIANEMSDVYAGRRSA